MHTARIATSSRARWTSAAKCVSPSGTPRVVDMDARLQRRVQRYGWDKASTTYEQYWSHQLAPAQARLLELADLKAGERVVDIACGTGLVTFPAARSVGPTGCIVGTDLSDEMV